MSDLRQDPLTGRWVILAAGRGARPDEFGLRQRVADDPAGRAACPFCLDHEDQTTPEILATGRPEKEPADGPGWRMRVFPNMFPALRPETEGEPTGGLLPMTPGVGVHEVVVYTTDHGAAPADLDRDAWVELLILLRVRVREIAARDDVRYISPFCNHGPEAGATLSHPHMQIIATPEVPGLAVDRSLRWEAHRASSGGCLMCDLVSEERRNGSRVVAENGQGVVVTPWASRFPFEMILMPENHAPSLADADKAEFPGLADLLAKALVGLKKLHGDLSLNLVFHAAPLRGPEGWSDGRLASLSRPPEDIFHWHVEILPRLSRTAGFEVGTGFSINSVLPEEAARLLRGEGD